jgi:hypothetical protein
MKHFVSLNQEDSDWSHFYQVLHLTHCYFAQASPSVQKLTEGRWEDAPNYQKRMSEKAEKSMQMDRSRFLLMTEKEIHQ